MGESQISVQDVLDNDYPLSLDPDFDGFCPCAHIKGNGFSIDVHCWRSSFNGCCCEYSGIHVSGSIDDKQKILLAEHVRKNNGWSESTDFAIVI